MKPFFVALTAVVAVTSLGVTAKVNSESNDLRTSVILKGQQSQKGVIVMLSERGDIAAEAAYMLSEQLQQNPGYQPLLVVPENDKLQGYKKSLSLNDEALPALIFFDKSGKELNRVTGTLPIAARTYPIRSASAK
ncbi:MAG TPA: hypothetical protein VD810_03560 [Methylophilaceae bacterium]|nr:hypothetical protein [Methylophilaceae bacterium]